MTHPPQILPLSALLSQAFVALTIESDTAFEQRAAHRTTIGGGRSGPWLTSVAMYFSCLRFLGEDGASIADLERRTGLPTNVDGMRRWRWVTLDPPPRSGRRAPRSTILRPTAAARAAAQMWPVVLDATEERWRDRCGPGPVDTLRTALTDLAARIERPLPDFLPILAHGMWTSQRLPGDPAEPSEPAGLPFVSLLARALLACAIPYERRSPVSLAIAANVLRLSEIDGAMLSELPRAAGVSAEAIAMATRWLATRGFAEIVTAAGPPRRRLLRLTATGLAARGCYDELSAAIESGWRDRFGVVAVDALRSALEAVVGDGSELLAGLAAPRGTWRAAQPAATALPHFPLVLHRGAFPDGS